MRARIPFALAAAVVAASFTLSTVGSSSGSAMLAAGKAAAAPMPIYPGLGSVHHEVTTASLGRSS
jgi:hypothetical protein